MVLTGRAWADDASAKPSEKPGVVFGAFLDTYYAYSFNKPVPSDRSFGNPAQLATTPARHNEFNVGLAYVDAKVSADRLRGRLALQAGTSVHANYLGELATSAAAGSLARHLQEATAGYRIGENLWVDAGIYLSHIGLESFLSKDNWTYTRSFIADFSPYYETGVKLSYQATPQWGYQLHVLNGWQNILDNDTNKAVGTQVSYAPNANATFSYNTFLGEETGAQWRFFNDFIAKIALTDSFQLAASLDVGFQRKAGTSDFSTWYGGALFGRYQLTTKVSACARVERYSDPDRIIVQPTSSALSFVANSASLNVDYELLKNLVWRNEVRVYWADTAVFSKAASFSRTDGLVVTSLAVSL